MLIVLDARTDEMIADTSDSCRTIMKDKTQTRNKQETLNINKSSMFLFFDLSQWHL